MRRILFIALAWCWGAMCVLAQNTETKSAETGDLSTDSIQAHRDSTTFKVDSVKIKAQNKNVPRASLKRRQIAASEIDSTDVKVPNRNTPRASKKRNRDNQVNEIDTIAASLFSDSITVTFPNLHVEPFVPNPIRSMWLSMVFPGAGQIYNHKYWKLPIIYGGFLGCVYAFSWNSQMLRDYSQAYLDIMDDDPNTKSYEKMLPMGYDITGKEERFKEVFKNKKNYFRKYRDMSIFAFAGVYLISVIDAYIDAELSTFDISRDLTLRWEPAILNNDNKLQRRYGQRALGLQCNLNF